MSTTAAYTPSSKRRRSPAASPPTRPHQGKAMPIDPARLRRCQRLARCSPLPPRTSPRPFPSSMQPPPPPLVPRTVRRRRRRMEGEGRKAARADRRSLSFSRPRARTAGAQHGCWRRGDRAAASDRDVLTVWSVQRQYPLRWRCVIAQACLESARESCIHPPSCENHGLIGRSAPGMWRVSQACSAAPVLVEGAQGLAAFPGCRVGPGPCRPLRSPGRARAARFVFHAPSLSSAGPTLGYTIHSTARHSCFSVDTPLQTQHQSVGPQCIGLSSNWVIV
jgi:hypothetical protein